MPRYNWYTRYEGHLNPDNPDELLVCYQFHLRSDAPESLQCRFLLKPEQDTRQFRSREDGSPYELAEYLGRAMEGWSSFGSRLAAGELSDYLFKWANADYEQWLRHKVEQKRERLAEAWGELRETRKRLKLHRSFMEERMEREA